MALQNSFSIFTLLPSSMPFRPIIEPNWKVTPWVYVNLQSHKNIGIASLYIYHWKYTTESLWQEKTFYENSKMLAGFRRGVLVS